MSERKLVMHVTQANRMWLTNNDFGVRRPELSRKDKKHLCHITSNSLFNIIIPQWRNAIIMKERTAHRCPKCEKFSAPNGPKIVNEGSAILSNIPTNMLA